MARPHHPYDGWPIGAEARLVDRLAVMPVRPSYGAGENGR
jgi:hypothetical protein